MPLPDLRDSFNESDNIWHVPTPPKQKTKTQSMVTITEFLPLSFSVCVSACVFLLCV